MSYYIDDVQHTTKSTYDILHKWYTNYIDDIQHTT